MACRDDTVEHVDAHCDAFHQVQGAANTHEVSRM
jgi:hypothetical protein